MIPTVPSLITNYSQILKHKCGTSSSDTTESLQSSGNTKHHSYSFMWFKQYKQYLLNTEHDTVIHVPARYFTSKTSCVQSDLGNAYLHRFARTA